MFFFGIGFWQNWVELVPVAWLALGLHPVLVSPFVADPGFYSQALLLGPYHFSWGT